MISLIMPVSIAKVIFITTWSVCHPLVHVIMSSYHPLNVHDGKKCSHAMFWSTYKTSADWLKCKSSQVTFENKQTNKQSPNNNFSSSYLYIHTQTCYWNDPHIGRGTSYHHHINQNIDNKSLRTRNLQSPSYIFNQILQNYHLSGRGTLPSWSVCDGSLSPCCSVCHWWGQGESQSFSWNYEMFVCYCCCKRVDDIMNLSNKLKLSWTAPQKFHICH